MYKVNVKQERFNEKRLQFDKVKDSLSGAIDEEHKRINVDSSKKRACLQHMDYDGFHQMVLGANLIPIKKGSIDSITINRLRGYDLNTHAALSEILTKNYKDKQEVLDGYISQYQLEDELKRVPKSQSEFEKYFSSKLKTSEERFKYILNIPISEVKTIFPKDVNCEVLVQILTVFKDVISDRISMKEETTEDEASTEENSIDPANDIALFSYIGDFIKLISKSEGFDFCVCFMSDKDKEIIVDICSGLQQFGYPDIEEIKVAYEIKDN